jgi:cytochrome b involved in lipid metabolism
MEMRKKMVLASVMLLVMVFLSACSLGGLPSSPSTQAPTADDSAGSDKSDSGNVIRTDDGQENEADSEDGSGAEQAGSDSSQSAGENTGTKAAKELTLEDISAHASPDDCWMAIGGKVYDVSGFAAKHGGGEAVYQGCGQDATTLFETRPMGSGTPHSEKARSFLPNFEIGVLKQ